jgi:hypothetical protein
MRFKKNNITSRIRKYNCDENYFEKLYIELIENNVYNSSSDYYLKRKI